MATVLRTRAVLLRSVDYGESDRIVTFLTEAYGLLSLMARGARRSRRRFAGALEPFSILEVELAHGRGQIGRLSSARMTQGFVRLLGSLARMQMAGRALEPLRGLLPEAHPEPEVFVATAALLASLDACDEALLEQWRWGYLAHVLSLLGVAPNLSACGSCGRVPGPSQPVQLDAVRGQIVCRACGGAPLRVSARARGLLIALSGSEWRTVSELAWPDALRDEVAAVVAACARAHGAHATARITRS